MIEMEVADFWKIVGVACGFVWLSGTFCLALGWHYGRRAGIRDAAANTEEASHEPR